MVTAAFDPSRSQQESAPWPTPAQTITGYPSLPRLLEEEYTLARVQAFGFTDYLGQRVSTKKFTTRRRQR